MPAGWAAGKVSLALPTGSGGCYSLSLPVASWRPPCATALFVPPSRREGQTCRSRLRAGRTIDSVQADAPPSGPVAQLAEQQTLNLLVEGSIPSGLTTNPNKRNYFKSALCHLHIVSTVEWRRCSSIQQRDGVGQHARRKMHVAHRRREVAVSGQLLHRGDERPAHDQVRAERVPQHVRTAVPDVRHPADTQQNGWQDLAFCPCQGLDRRRKLACFDGGVGRRFIRERRGRWCGRRGLRNCAADDERSQHQAEHDREAGGRRADGMPDRPRASEQRQPGGSRSHSTRGARGYLHLTGQWSNRSCARAGPEAVLVNDLPPCMISHA